MKQELRQTLKLVQQQVTEATEGYEWDEQAEFFGRHEILSAPPEMEVQDYEEEYNV